MSALPEAVSEIDEYRAAARRIARNTIEGSPLTPRDQWVALVRLAERCRQEAALPEMGQEAIWQECEGILWERDPLNVPGDAVEQALRRLVAEGYSRCDRCKRALPGKEEFRAWEARRRARMEELEAREKAVS